MINYDEKNDIMYIKFIDNVSWYGDGDDNGVTLMRYTDEMIVGIIIDDWSKRSKYRDKKNDQLYICLQKCPNSYSEMIAGDFLVSFSGATGEVVCLHIFGCTAAEAALSR